MSVAVRQGDALAVTKTLESNSIDCCPTSPPYFHLRDYSEPGQWGMEPTVDGYLEHLWALYDEVKRVLKPSGVVFVNLGDTYQNDPGGQNGGRIRNGQGARTLTGHGGPKLAVLHGISAKIVEANRRAGRQDRRGMSSVPRKSLMMIPERFALGMVERGWILRNRIAWHKPNAMPSSVRDRFACTWEYVWFFTKRERYWSDLDAVRVPHSSATIQRIMQASVHSQTGGPKQDEFWEHSAGRPQRSPHEVVRSLAAKYGNGPGGRLDGVEAAQPFCDRSFGAVAERLAELPAALTFRRNGSVRGQPMQPSNTATHREDRDDPDYSPLGRNPGDMWYLPTQAFPDAHFAVWPEELARKLLLFGCPLRVCPTCKRPWERDKERIKHPSRDVEAQRAATAEMTGRRDGHVSGPSGMLDTVVTRGWVPVCKCPPQPPEAGWAYDPFGGSGTTGVVATRLGLNVILGELNPEYVEMAKRRIRDDAPLFNGDLGTPDAYGTTDTGQSDSPPRSQLSLWETSETV